MKKDNAENESPSKLAIPWKGNLRRVSDIDIVMLPEYQWKWYSSKKNLWRSTTVTQVSSKGHALGLLDLIRFRDSRKFLIWTRRIRRTFQSSVEYLTFLSLIFRRRGKKWAIPRRFHNIKIPRYKRHFSPHVFAFDFAVHTTPTGVAGKTVR